MDEEEREMAVNNYSELAYHVGHGVVVVTYHGVNAAVECEDCGVVLVDFDA